jgi:hypothetical protein
VPSLLDRLDPVAEATMRNLIGGAMRTQAVYVAAKLGIADQLSLGAQTAEHLAERVNAHAMTLRRVLRFLVANGVFVENEDGCFALNRAAESLQTAHPRSLRLGAIRAGESMWASAAAMLAIVQSGRTPDADTFFARKRSTFDQRMASSTRGLGEALAELESVRNATSIVDIGGGNGALLDELLRALPHARGILFDRAETIANARSGIERCEVVAGDFFESVPAADVHVLSWILHDWSDDDALRILRACHAAGARTLIVVEALLPDRAQPFDATGVIADPYTLDMQMLLLTGGRERTQSEYRMLLGESGYEVVGVRKLASERGASALEARART